MDFIDILNNPLVRFIIILSSTSLLLFKETRVPMVVGGIIAFSYFTSFIVSSFSINKERLYNSLIYRGYIKNSEENKHENFILVDQIILSVLYLSIFLGLYILKTDPNRANSIIRNLGIIIVILVFAKFLIPPLLIDSSWRVPSFNTIQSYVYSSSIVFIVLISSFIYYLSKKNSILQNIFKILIVLTTIYLILSPLVNHYNYVECSYFNEENCRNNENCVYNEGQCLDLSPPPPGVEPSGGEPSGGEPSGGPPSGGPPPSPPPCSSYNDESGCNSGNNCYYIKNRDDVSDLTEDKLKDLTECINSDEKCKGEYDIPCSGAFEPTNRFNECCYDTLFKDSKFEDSNCIESEMLSRMNSDQIVDTRKEENKTQEGRVGDYSLKSGEKQIEYEAIKGYCYESNIRKDMEAGIYA